MICKGDGANAGKDKVFGDFIGKGTDGNEQNICGANLLLRLNTPESDLAIVEGNLICMGGG